MLGRRLSAVPPKLGIMPHSFINGNNRLKLLYSLQKLMDEFSPHIAAFAPNGSSLKNMYKPTASSHSNIFTYLRIISEQYF